MNSKTPISMLQEVMVASKKPPPVYHFANVTKNLEPKFSCTVEIGDLKVIAEARNKKDAKQIAANQALIKLGYTSQIKPLMKTNELSISKVGNELSISKVENVDETLLLPSKFNVGSNYIGKLHEYASGSGLPYPTYHEDMFAASDGLFQTVCEFGEMTAKGSGHNKKLAKQISSFNMLSMLKNCEPTRLVRKPMYLADVVDTTADKELEKMVITKFNNLSIKQNLIRGKGGIVEANEISSNPNIKMIPTASGNAVVSNTESGPRVDLSLNVSLDLSNNQKFNRKLFPRLFSDDIQCPISDNNEKLENLDGYSENPFIKKRYSRVRRKIGILCSGPQPLLKDQDSCDNETVDECTTSELKNDENGGAIDKKSNGTSYVDDAWGIDDEYTIFGKFVSEKLRNMDSLDAKILKGNIMFVVNEFSIEKEDGFKQYNAYDALFHETY